MAVAIRSLVGDEKARREAGSSVNVEVGTRYQLDFFTPGSIPWFASSRNTIRDTPNLRM